MLTTNCMFQCSCFLLLCIRSVKVEKSVSVGIRSCGIYIAMKSARTRAGKSPIRCLQCEPHRLPAFPALHCLTACLHMTLPAELLNIPRYNWWRCGVFKNISTLELRSRTLPPVIPNSIWQISPTLCAACSGALLYKDHTIFSGTVRMSMESTSGCLNTSVRAYTIDWMIPPSEIM